MSDFFCQRFCHKYFSLAAIALVLLSDSTRARDHRDWSYNLGIYEVNVRQYTEEGTFAAFREHLERLQEMGVGILWFMPVHPIGRQNRLGSLGSYYSVRDYMDVNPEFGSLDDFRTLVQEIHERGMYVIIDWVANHTSWDNSLTTEHPEWYCRDVDGNFISPPGTNWSDVIELDYAQQGLRDYMVEAMKFWVANVGIDGFRCDAVSFVPQDFWKEAICELKVFEPDLLLLAEGDGRVWHELGFDMTYGWGLYGFGNGVLKRIAEGIDTAAELNDYATGEKAQYSDEAYRMYFTSNHDENSWHGTPTELFGEAAGVFDVLTATFNGMPLIYSGQEAGLDKRLQFFDKDQIMWCDDEKTTVYKTLLHLKKENKALWNGGFGGPLQRAPTSNDVDVFAFVREKAEDKVLVALNLSDRAQDVTLLGTSFIGNYRDVFTDEIAVLGEEADLSLPAWSYRVYEARDVNTGAREKTLPFAFELCQNYPNPFNSATTISYWLAAPMETKLTIVDMLGRTVQVLNTDTKQAGKHEITFSAAGLPSGLYVIHLQAGSHTGMKRMIVQR
jgi:glycosidase